MTTDSKPLLLIYGDGAIRIVANVKLREGSTVYEEAVYVGRSRLWVVDDPRSIDLADDIVTRTFVKRAETARYDVYEEWS